MCRMCPIALTMMSHCQGQEKRVFPHPSAPIHPQDRQFASQFVHLNARWRVMLVLRVGELFDLQWYLI